MHQIIGLDCSNAIHSSAKVGIMIICILEVHYAHFYIAIHAPFYTVKRSHYIIWLFYVDFSFLKEGIGIIEILNAIVQRIPSPKETADKPLRALIFDR